MRWTKIGRINTAGKTRALHDASFAGAAGRKPNDFFEHDNAQHFVFRDNLWSLKCRFFRIMFFCYKKESC